MIKTAMVLAAGFGKRMRPLTDHTAKPLVPFQGRALIDHVLDRLVASGVERAVVNVHHFADRVEAHVGMRRDIQIEISDERGLILDTGGGVKKALAQIGDDPFFIMSADTVWVEGPRNNLSDLAATYDPHRMDMQLLLACTSSSIGEGGRGDFQTDGEGRLARRGEAASVPFSYASAMIAHPGLYADTPDGPFSNNVLFDRAIARNRLYGHRLDGVWMHIGTPQALAEAERAVAENAP